jgi:hypothetical protein
MGWMGAVGSGFTLNILNKKLFSIARASSDLVN